LLDADAPALEPVCGGWNVCGFASVPWIIDGGGLPAGNVNLRRFTEHGQAEIGYWLGPGAPGRGLATTRGPDRDQLGLHEPRPQARRVRDPAGTQPPIGWPSASARPRGIREKAHEAGSQWWDMNIYAVERQA
jgi:hypothetical protein